MIEIKTKMKRPQARPTERTDARRSAERILREAAFVLHMTQRVRNAIRMEKTPAEGSWC